MKTCILSFATNKAAQISLPAQFEQHPFIRFIDSRISTHVKASLIMLKTRMSMVQLVSVAVEAGLNFTWSPGNPEDTFRMVWLNSELIILRSAVTNLRDQGVWGSSLTKGAALWL